MHSSPRDLRRVVRSTGLLVAMIACTQTESSDPRALRAAAEVTQTPIVRGIDHFFATSPTPETHYRYFRDSGEASASAPKQTQSRRKGSVNLRTRLARCAASRRGLCAARRSLREMIPSS